MRRYAGVLLIGWATALSGCGFLGASEITVEARNDSDLPMVVQVVEGIGGEGQPYGPAHTLGPLEEREVELAVPAGDWTVTVNDARLMESLDASGRRGRLPVTLIVPAPDDPVPGPYWESPAGWSDAGT